MYYCECTCAISLLHCILADYERQLKLSEVFCTDDHEQVSKRTKSTAEAVDNYDHAKSLEELTDQSTTTTTSSAGPSSTSGTCSSMSDSDSSLLFVPAMRSILPDDISQCRDDKPVQPHLRFFQRSRDGDRNRSFSVHT